MVFAFRLHSIALFDRVSCPLPLFPVEILHSFPLPFQCKTLAQRAFSGPTNYDTRTALDSPLAVATFFGSVIAAQSDYEPEKEHLVAILLNAKFRPIGYHLVATGSLSECIAHPREIFRPAIVAAAYAFVLAHNHPSGDPAPSEADRRLTRRLHEGAELLQMRLLDHVIIGFEGEGTPRYFSFKESAVL